MLFLKRGVEGFFQSFWAKLTAQDLGLGASGDGTKYLADDMEWKTFPAIPVGIPPGGTTDQVLSKDSATDYDVSWKSLPTPPAGLPTGGTAGQALKKVSATDFDVSWQDDDYIGEAPNDGQEYVRKNEAWAVATGGGGGGISEAPNDGQHYARRNEAWEAFSPGIGDAPSDGDRYLRRNGDWEKDPNQGQAWPVGSIFIAAVSTNPATLLGYGTWSRYAHGRVLVGLDEEDVAFDTLEETGGSKTHTLTTSEIPVHNHGVTDPGHSHGITDPGHFHRQRRLAGAGSAGHNAGGASDNTQASATETETNTTGITVNSATTGITTNNAGGGGAHNNLQPYIAVYMWKRTA